MREQIRFNDTGKKVNVTIDNETEQLPIKSIIKIPTFIELQKPLNTPLKEDIILDAHLCYIANDNDAIVTEDDIIYDDETNPSFIIPDNTKAAKIHTDGIVNIVIYDDAKTYYNDDIIFYEGHIQASIPNELPLGLYKCKIKYTGSKYFEASETIINFNIERRPAYCKFDTEKIYGHLKETLTIYGVLRDKITNKIIKDCPLQYKFNGNIYDTQTDNAGVFFANVTIPDGDITHCHQYAIEETSIIVKEEGDPYVEEYQELIRDEDGNIVFNNDAPKPIEIKENNNTQNNTIDDNEAPEEETRLATSYPIVFDTNIDSSYYLNDATVLIDVIKADTVSDVNAGAYNQTNRTVNFNGNILANISDTFTDVHYGKVQIQLLDFNYTHDVLKVDTNGRFTTDIDMAKVYLSYNNTDIDDLVPYQCYNDIYHTSLILDTTESYEANETTITVGQPIIAEVNIKTVTKDIVTDGMVKFDLYRGNEKVYTYATELDDVGIGVFAFNTSRSGQYTLKAKYYGLFGYNSCEAEKKIEVQD